MIMRPHVVAVEPQFDVIYISLHMFVLKSVLRWYCSLMQSIRWMCWCTVG